MGKPSVLAAEMRYITTRRLFGSRAVNVIEPRERWRAFWAIWRTCEGQRELSPSREAQVKASLELLLAGSRWTRFMLATINRPDYIANKPPVFLRWDIVRTERARRMGMAQDLGDI